MEITQENRVEQVIVQQQDGAEEIVTIVVTEKNGKDGMGVPIGGAVGQVLTKKSDNDFDAEWTDPQNVEGSDVNADNVGVALSEFEEQKTIGETDSLVGIGKKRFLFSVVVEFFESLFAEKDHVHSYDGLATVAQVNEKVTKVAGKSLISDTEIARLASVENYDDSLLLTELAKKINASETLTAVEIQLLISNLVDSSPEALNTFKELSNALGDDPNFATTVINLIATKVSAVTGKSLISDTEIIRLANVFNYDDTNLRNLISNLRSFNSDLEFRRKPIYLAENIYSLVSLPSGMRNATSSGTLVAGYGVLTFVSSTSANSGYRVYTHTAIRILSYWITQLDYVISIPTGATPRINLGYFNGNSQTSSNVGEMYFYIVGNTLSYVTHNTATNVVAMSTVILKDTKYHLRIAPIYDSNNTMTSVNFIVYDINGVVLESVNVTTQVPYNTSSSANVVGVWATETVSASAISILNLYHSAVTHNQPLIGGALT